MERTCCITLRILKGGINMTYKLNHNEYTNIVRRLADVIRFHESETVKELLMELLRVRYDDKNLYFEVDEDLMRLVAIVNMCDMSLQQMEDSCGEIDYAYLGDHSKSVLWNILHNINNL
jgi:hypothetical protein